MSETVIACPQCDSPRLYHRGGRQQIDGVDKEWLCRKCKHEFDEATKREPKVKIPYLNGLAKTLSNMDPDEVPP